VKQRGDYKSCVLQQSYSLIQINLFRSNRIDPAPRLSYYNLYTTQRGFGALGAFLSPHVSVFVAVRCPDDFFPSRFSLVCMMAAWLYVSRMCLGPRRSAIARCADDFFLRIFSLACMFATLLYVSLACDADCVVQRYSSDFLPRVVSSRLHVRHVDLGVPYPVHGSRVSVW
jgi:hypothetical protein